jgi:polar amino acid transport system substrate-binding protein
MRKLAALVLPLMIVLAACGDGEGTAEETEEATAPESGATAEATEDESAAAEVEFTPMTEGVLTVGTELPAPPFWIGEDYESIEGGYEYDLATEIANRLGLDQVEVVEMPFTGLVAGQDCPCDVDFSQVTITDDRAEVVDFTTPYFDANQGVLVQEGTDFGDSEEELQGLQWGVQLNTTGAEYLTSTIQPSSEAQVYNTVVDLFTALRAGQVDAVMMDVPIVAGEANREGSGLEVVGQFETGEQYGGVLSKDDPNTEAISQIIEEMKADGFIEELANEYFQAESVPVLG